MKILFATRKYPPSVGGMELFAYDLSNALADKTDLVLVKWGGTGHIRAVLVALPYIALKSFFKLLGGGIDVIHVNDGVLAPLGYVLSRLFRKPFTVGLHGLDITYKNPLFRVIVPWSVRRADHVFCISHAAAEEAIKRGVSKDRVEAVPIAVRDELFGKSDRAALVKGLDLPEDSQILLTVGRLVKRKGVEWFIDEVLPGLVKEFPKIVYLVVGQGEERESIEEAVKRHKLSGHVRLTGRLDGELYDAAYNGADVFVMPNIVVTGDMEGFGLVLLEAAVCERPVVAAGIEGIRDAVVDGKNGVLAPTRDAKAFHKAIARFLKDRSYAREFGKEARKYSLDNYKWPKIAGRYVTVYKSLID